MLLTGPKKLGQEQPEFKGIFIDKVILFLPLVIPLELSYHITITSYEYCHYNLLLLGGIAT